MCGLEPDDSSGNARQLSSSLITSALPRGNCHLFRIHATKPSVAVTICHVAWEGNTGVTYKPLGVITELLEEREGLRLSRPTVRWILVQAGLSSPQRRRPPQHRCRRQRMPQEGMLLQLDGSHHGWLEDRGPGLTLLLAVDDATGTAPYALFQEQGDTRGYLSLLQGIIERRGIPLAVYTDGHAVFQPRRGPPDLSQVSGKGRQPNGVERWKNWGLPRYRPTVPRPKEGWSEPMALSRTDW